MLAADVDPERVARLVRAYGAVPVDPADADRLRDAGVLCDTYSA